NVDAAIARIEQPVSRQPCRGEGKYVVATARGLARNHEHALAACKLYVCHAVSIRRKGGGIEPRATRRRYERALQAAFRHSPDGGSINPNTADEGDFHSAGSPCRLVLIVRSRSPPRQLPGRDLDRPDIVAPFECAVRRE